MCDAVKKELGAPRRLLGYRAMNHKLRTEHNVQVPRHLVHNVIAELDPKRIGSQKTLEKEEETKR